ncbi:MAG: tryptophan 7-halogenase [Sphingomonadales bacterium]|nr:tryptophan 7-halogenase [Sphingomonadales bacterium]
MTRKSPSPYIQILGGGLAGWSAAAILAEQFSGTAAIHIDGAQEDTPAESAAYAHMILGGESILMQHIGMTPADLITLGRGGFWLGTCFEKWGAKGRNVYHAPGEALPVKDGLSAHQILRRLSVQEGKDGLFTDLCLPLAFQARMAAAGKFSPPSADRQSPRSLLRPGVALDGSALTAVMRDKAMASGVRVAAGMEDEPLLIVDCRPQEKAKDIDCRQALGFDRYVTLRLEGAMPHPPHDSIRPLDNGWMTILPLQGGALITLYYHSSHWTDAQAKQAAYDALPESAAAIITSGPIYPGRMERPWQGNSVHLGVGAAQLGSAMGAEVTLLSHQLETLITLLPGGKGDDMPSKSAEYNRRVAAHFDHIRDFLHLPFVRNGLTGPYWEQAKKQAIAPDLHRRLGQFERRGLLVMIDDDPFEKHSWLEMMTGLGIIPALYDHVTDGVDLSAKMRDLGSMVVAFDQTIAAMPTHEDFLAQMAARMTG